MTVKGSNDACTEGWPRPAAEVFAALMRRSYAELLDESVPERLVAVALRLADAGDARTETPTRDPLRTDHADSAALA